MTVTSKLVLLLIFFTLDFKKTVFQLPKHMSVFFQTYSYRLTLNFVSWNNLIIHIFNIFMNMHDQYIAQFWGMKRSDILMRKCYGAITDFWKILWYNGLHKNQIIVRKFLIDKVFIFVWYLVSLAQIYLKLYSFLICISISFIEL